MYINKYVYFKMDLLSQFWQLFSHTLHSHKNDTFADCSFAPSKKYNWLLYVKKSSLISKRKNTDV